MLTALEFMKQQDSINPEVDALKVTVLEIAVELSKTALRIESGITLPSIILKELDALDEAIQKLESYYNVETKNTLPTHYSGKDNIDVIEFLGEHSSLEGFTASMMFNIVKYTTRLGRKDSVEAELNKIRTYFIREKKFVFNYFEKYQTH